MKKWLLVINCLFVAFLDCHAASKLAMTATNTVASNVIAVSPDRRESRSELNAGCEVKQSTKQSSISWKLPKYSLVARGLSLREAFKTFAAAQGISVVMSDTVNGIFSGEFRDMPSEEFLRRVTTIHNLVWYFDGAVLYLYGSDEVQSRLFNLRYMKAAEVCAMLRELGIEDKRYPMRTASNDEMILVSGPPRYVALIMETIGRADALREQRTFNEVETRLFPLQHTWADDVSLRVSGPESAATIRGVATMLRELMQESAGQRTKDASPTDSAKDGTSESAKIEETTKDDSSSDVIEPFRPIIRAENRLNAVVVRDAITRMPMYERLVKQLDKPQPLIEILVTKIEMSREDALDWQLSLAVSGSHRDIQGSAGQNAANLARTLGGKGLAGTMWYISDSVQVEASLSALRERGKARNVSRTALLTVNNMAARLTDMQSYHARVVGTEVATLEEVSAGTELEIKPRLVVPATTNDSTRVWLTMALQDGGFESISVDSMPMTSESMLETQALVPVGESILLAGYLRDVKEEGGWGIPYLRDIPWIGWLFGGKSWRNETVQRLFVLTPQIIYVSDRDIVRDQATRQRDLAEAMMLERDSDADYATRREEEARVEEMRQIHEEKAQETFERNEAERDFRREQRKDKRKDSRAAWEKDYEERREMYRDAREQCEKEREARK